MKRVVKTMTCVDENGKSLGPPKIIPEPDSFTTDGLARIGGYVSRLLRSPGSFASVIIATPDEKVAILLWVRDRVPEISLTLEWRTQTKREAEIRHLFAKRMIAPVRDYLGRNGGIADSTRCLSYALLPDEQAVTSLAKEILREIYGVSERDGLDFTYDEKKKA